MSSSSFARPAGPAPRPLSAAALELVAGRFAALAEPRRLRLVQALFAGERSVNALVAEVGGTQGNVSRHLQTLRQAGVLSRRRAGARVFYALADPGVLELCALVCGSVEQQIARHAEALGGR